MENIMTRVAVILSGCGHLDGAEIRESVLSLLYLDQAGTEVSTFAPDVELNEVANRSGDANGATRNVLAEAARIPPCHISPVANAKAEDFDVMVLAGEVVVPELLADLDVPDAVDTVLPEF